MYDVIDSLGTISAEVCGIIIAIVSISLTTWFAYQQRKNSSRVLSLTVARDIHEIYFELYPILASLPDDFSKLDKDQKQTITKYVNLCAEEYLWQKKGIIEREVWEVWRNTIIEKFQTTVIGDVWKRELRNDKYYEGFKEFIDRTIS
jgi:hypothetical protein